MREAALYPAARLFELLPQAPHELWQAGGTYRHIPGHGFGYAVAVIDYDLRYLLAGHFTASYTAADVAAVLDEPRAEAERWHGPPVKTPVPVPDTSTDIGRSAGSQWPELYRPAFPGPIQGKFASGRIHYRTPMPRGLLERFHPTLKHEEV